MRGNLRWQLEIIVSLDLRNLTLSNLLLISIISLGAPEVIHYLLNSLVGLLREICWRLLGIIGVVWSTLSESVIRSTIIVTGSVASKVVLRTWSWCNLERALSPTYEWRRILNIRFVLERFRQCERSAAASPLKFHLYSIILSLWWNLLFNLVFDLLSLELLLSQYVLIRLHDTL